MSQGHEPYLRLAFEMATWAMERDAMGREDDEQTRQTWHKKKLSEYFQHFHAEIHQAITSDS